ncbi:hypothetical protein Rxyl_2490 [Rubrobacter xylanophilus DSM 9941]|uniref:Uncharacterized protein n=1 Tax=Rubrobacter xylanophilus (strain DSM 9941 / JCM 11954 / NBRC 16129 / PRD-1) TaxID=266117 RepID=Q1AT63_RUBXD|nr:hypothetical protein Rxyl_2490 [Rubrobacter xylanophilus DSM 9941]
MVLSHPASHQHRHAFPRLHSSDQSRPSGERHPQKKQTLCLSELARAYPVPEERRVSAPRSTACFIV